MRAGELNRVIELQSNTPTRDNTGESIDNWQTYITVWGGWRRFKGTKNDTKHQHDREISSNHAKLVIYHIEGIKEGHRVIDTTKGRNTAYEIIHIEPVGYESELHLTCKAVT